MSDTVVIRDSGGSGAAISLIEFSIIAVLVIVVLYFLITRLPGINDIWNGLKNLFSGNFNFGKIGTWGDGSGTGSEKGQSGNGDTSSGSQATGTAAGNSSTGNTKTPTGVDALMLELEGLLPIPVIVPSGNNYTDYVTIDEYYK